MHKNYCYGPIRSRRLGRSLGVDVIPFKTCSLDCIYCECGPTTCLTLERKEYFPTQDILRSLESCLNTGPALDYITFAGSGEPTLHRGLGEIINFLKERYPQYRVAVLTNATLLNDKEVINDLQKTDLIVPSLDAVSRGAFEKINRPAAGCSGETIISGIKNLKENFSGEIWLEIFLVPGINDTPEELALFQETLERLNIKKVQLNTLDRPGAVNWIKPLPKEQIQKIALSLGNVEIVK